MRIVNAILVLASVTGTAAAQQAPAPVVTAAEAFNFDRLAAQGKALVEQSRQGSGSAGMPLSNYGGSFMTLNARVKDGGGELHRKFSDFLIVVDGEGTELTGGTLVDSKEGANGEVRGSRLEGAVAHPLHKGDMIHVPAGVPHQQLVTPGKSLTVLAIKVAEPAT